MTWQQIYNPLGNLWTSALLASVPIILLLVLLGGFHWRAHRAAGAALIAALLLAVFGFQMPVSLAASAAGYGVLFGLFPIGWIVINAIFLYQLSIETGEFDALKNQIARLSDDPRIQALLIAFCFGAFIEGCAGFGAPVAICGAMLLGLGFKPLEAAKLSLIGNTAPVAFGSVGIPITTLHSVTGLDLQALTAMVGRQLPVFSLIVPFWLIAVQVGWRGMLEVWPACLVCGASFAAIQFIVSNYHGPWLVDTASAIAAMVALVTLLRFWRPQVAHPARESKGKVLRAWLPWLMLTVFVALWSVPAWKQALNNFSAPKIPILPLHLAVQRMPPVVPVPESEKAEFIFNWLTATGTALLLAGIVSGLLLGVRPGALVRLYGQTLWRVRVSLLTIALMLALGFTTRYSGTDTAIGLAFAHTGSWFPFFSPLLGWLGVALTGSDTSSNVLFGNLQKTTAEQLGISPILTAAANTSGGVMGKMIDAQSIVVANVATGGTSASPGAGTILRAVFWHSLALATLVGVLVWLQAVLFPWMIPTPH
jgi:lactate permease